VREGADGAAEARVMAAAEGANGAEAMVITSCFLFVLSVRDIVCRRPEAALPWYRRRAGEPIGTRRRTRPLSAGFDGLVAEDQLTCDARLRQASRRLAPG
jgi:hypothetical protein